MIKRIGVIGAGQMGSGIAHVCALKGFDIRIADVDQAHLEKGMDAIGRNMDRQIGRGMIRPEDKDAAFRRITTGTDYKQFADCDLIVEAATENEQVKREIFKKVCVDLPANVLLATNTSSISVTRLASVTDRPGKFMGMHFMNPVPMMGLVELIRGIATEEETFRTVRDVVVKLDKKPVNAEDFPAFIVNRILLPMINEAVYALYEGVGNVEAIDTGMKLGANHPMGPLELADFIGLDTCLSVMQVLHEGLADPKYRPCPLLVKYVEAGWVGRKVKRGFYDYSGERPVPTRLRRGRSTLPGPSGGFRVGNDFRPAQYRPNSDPARSLPGWPQRRGRVHERPLHGRGAWACASCSTSTTSSTAGLPHRHLGEGHLDTLFGLMRENGSASAAKRCSSTSAHTGASMH